jgi:hypothetical protein
MTALIISGWSVSAQPAFHSAFAYQVIEQGKKQLDLGFFNAPIYGIASHIAADRMIGESALEYQLDIAGVRYLIMYVNTPDDQKMTFIVDSFWGLFPDIWDKCLNRHDFHFKFDLIFNMDSGATNLLEEITVFSYTVKF